MSHIQQHQTAQATQQKPTQVAEQAQNTVQQIVQKTQQISRGATEKMEKTAERVSGEVNQVINPDERVPKFYNGEPYSNSFQRANEKVGEVVEDTKQTVHDAASKVKKSLVKNPVNWFAVAGVALATVGIMAIVATKIVRAN